MTARLMLPMTLLVALAMSAGVRAENGGAAPTCASCDPASLVDAAQTHLVRALQWRLKDGREPEERPLLMLLRAEDAAAAGDDAAALAWAKRAAGRCMLHDDAACAEALELWVELELGQRGGDAEAEQEVLALLSLLPYEQLRATRCTELVALRFRLAERRAPGSVDPTWADRCGRLGGTGETGYRAAKAALKLGQHRDAARRLKRLRVMGEGYLVRAAYLAAVLHTARGRVNAAARSFEIVASLPPSSHRGEKEADARQLAQIQLARLYREMGRYEQARAAYHGVPPGSPWRGDALLEGAVVAAHMGDLGAARNMLDALERYAPPTLKTVELYRVRANLEVVDGDEAEALKVFAKLSEMGRSHAERVFAPDKPDPTTLLADDPSLGGLLDPSEHAPIEGVQGGLAQTRREISASRARAERLVARLKARGLEGPLRNALDELDEADLLLRRAENLMAQRQARGVRIAGPAQSALAVFTRAKDVRRSLDAARARLGAQHKEKSDRLLREVRAVLSELDLAEARLAELSRRAGPVIEDHRDLLVGRALRVVERMEISEDIGRAELALRKKQAATRAIQQLADELMNDKAGLKADRYRAWDQLEMTRWYPEPTAEDPALQRARADKSRLGRPRVGSKR